MNRKYFAKTLLIVGTILMMAALVITGCDTPINIASSVTGITPTPVTPSPTPRICPPDINLNGLEPLKTTPTFIVVLFDANSTRENVLEYANGEKTADVMDFVGTVLPKVLGPGSQYSLFSLGYRGYEAAKFDRYSSKITESPEIVETPAPYSTLTPIPTPTTSDAVLENQVAKNEYEVAVSAQQATATQLAFEDNCEVMVYDSTYKATATAWSVTKQAEEDEIAVQISNARQERENDIRVIETPFATNNVYEGLAHVTVDFESQCQYYDRCVLLIFDDLTDWRNAGPNNKIPDLHINLDGVEVLSVLSQCEDIIQPSCVKTQNLWTDEFTDVFGAEKVDYHNGERLEEFLIETLGGK